MAIPEIPPEFDELTTEEKVAWAQRVWQRIADAEPALELTDEERTELDRRLKNHESDPSEVVSWQALKNNLQGD